MSASISQLSQVRNSRSIMEESQNDFLRRGGGYQLGLRQLRDAGILDKEYVYREYPKMLRIPVGEPHDVERSTEIGNGSQLRYWTERNVQDYEEIIVNSEDEEERVLAGGKTSVQLEEERQGLLSKARAMGLRADPSWSAVRLRRELGEQLDAPEPVNETEQLRAQLAALEEKALLRARIAELEAKLSAQDSAQKEPKRDAKIKGEQS